MPATRILVLTTYDSDGDILLHIFANLGVDDRTAAATAAMERGRLRLNK